MKKYFTKWLPVEGDFKVGDRIGIPGKTVFPFVEDRLMTNIDVEAVGMMKSEYLKSKGLVHHKLFLCSKETYYGGEPPVGIYNDSKVIGPNILEANKVIGEISPDALSYVKDGNEYDEDDWTLRMKVDNLSSGSIEVDKKHLHRFKKRGIISFCAIKGPCGHFH